MMLPNYFKFIRFFALVILFLSQSYVQVQAAACTASANGVAANLQLVNGGTTGMFTVNANGAFGAASTLRIMSTTDVGTGTSAWFLAQQRMINGFQASFNFLVTGTNPEGFAFVIQGSSSSAQGGASENLGYAFAKNVAVEFDMFKNTFASGTAEPNANHVEVHSNFAGINSPDGSTGAYLGGSISYSNLGADQLSSLVMSTAATTKSIPVTINYTPKFASTGNAYTSADIGSITITVGTIALNPISISDASFRSICPNYVCWFGFTSSSGAASTASIDISNFKLLVLPVSPTLSQFSLTGSSFTITASNQPTTPPLTITTVDVCNQPFLTSPGGVTAAWSGTAPTGQTVNSPIVTDNQNGSFGITFWSTQANSYTGVSPFLLQLQASGVSFGAAGTPYPVIVNPAAPSTATSTFAAADNLSSFTSGVPRIFNINAYDQFGNGANALTANFAILILPPGALAATTIAYTSAAISTVNSNTPFAQYTFSVLLKKAQTVTMRFTLGSSDILKSPLQNVVVSASIPSAGACVLSGQGLTTATAGVPAYFSLAPFDVNNNPITDPAQLAAMIIQGSMTQTGNAAVSVPVSAKLVSSANPPYFNVTYTATVATTYTAAVALGGNNGGNVALNVYQNVNVLPSSLSAVTSTITFPGGSTSATAGVLTVLTLQGVDAFHNNLASDAGVPEPTVSVGGVSAICNGAAGTANTVISLLSCQYYQNGQYHVSVTALKTTPALTVTATTGAGVAFTNPLAFTVVPGPASASTSFISGVPPSVVAGATASFVVNVFDAFGNARSNTDDTALITGAGVLVATTTPPTTYASVLSTVRTANTNLYTVSFTGTFAAVYNISASISGPRITNVQPSNFISIVPAADYGPYSLFSGAGLQGGAALSTVTFSVTTRDLFNNTVLAKATRTWTGNVVQGTASAMVTFTSTDTITFQGSYTVPPIGTSSVMTITLQLTGSGGPVVFTAFISLGTSFAAVTPALATSYVSGVPSTFNIVDYNTAALTTPLPDANSKAFMSITFTPIAPATGNINPGQVLCQGSTAATLCANRVASFTPVSVGTFQLHIFANGIESTVTAPAPATYIVNVIAGPIDPFQSSVVPITSNQFQAGTPFSYTVTLRDANKNILKGITIQNVGVTTTPATTFLNTPTSNNNGDGTLTVSVTFTLSGTYPITTTVNGVQLNTLITVIVTPGTFNPAMSSWALQHDNTFFVGGLPAIITLQGKDLFGNAVTDYSLVTLAAQVNGVATASPLVTPGSPALVQFTSTIANYAVRLPLSLWASVSGSPLTQVGQNATVSYFSGDVSGPLSSFTYPKNIVAGSTVTVTLILKDVYGNLWSPSSLTAATTPVSAQATQNLIRGTSSSFNNGGQQQFTFIPATGELTSQFTVLQASPSNWAFAFTAPTRAGTASAPFVPQAGQDPTQIVVIAGPPAAPFTLVPGFSNPNIVASPTYGASTLIQLADNYTNPVPVGGATITFLAYSASNAQQCVNGQYNPAALVTYFNAASTISDLQNGQYNLTVVSTKSGQYFIRLFVNGGDVQPSCSANTLSVLVQPGPVCPTCSQVLTNGPARAGTLITFSIILVDKYYNPIVSSTASGISAPTVGSGNAALPCPANPLATATALFTAAVTNGATPGTYTATTSSVTVAGVYSLQIIVSNSLVSIGGLCPTLTVFAGYVANFTVQFPLSPAGFTGLNAGAASPVQLQAYGFDAFGNPVSTATYGYSLLVTRLNGTNTLSTYTFPVSSVVVPAPGLNNTYLTYQTLSLTYAWEGSYQLAISLIFDTTDPNRVGHLPVQQTYFATVVPFACGAVTPSNPFRCPASATGGLAGMCESSYAMCTGVNQVATDLTCPAGTMACTTASSTQCVPANDQQQCPVGLSDYACAPGFVACPNGDCRASLLGCPSTRACAPGTVLCPDQYTCSDSALNCPTTSFETCGAGLFQCRDGRCATRRENCGTDVSCAQTGYVVCPDGSCQSSASNCVALDVCVQPNPFRCPKGACRPQQAVGSVSDCPTSVSCPIGWALCESGHCRANVTECPAPLVCPNGQIRCPSGSCAADILLCPSLVTCPSINGVPGVLCASGACVADVALCPAPATCPVGFTQCPGIGGIGSCVSSFAACPSLPSCPAFAPVLCPDGSCVPSAASCSSTSLSYSPNVCPRRFSVRCPDGSCAASVSGCSASSTCLPSSPFRCPDGKCVSATDMCFATNSMTALTVSYACPAGQFRCPSGVCSASLATCGSPLACQLGYSRCLDGTCSPTACPKAVTTSCPSSLLQCPQTHQGLSCVLSLADCPQSSVCPLDQPVRCPDASCAASVNDCVAPASPPLIPCASGAFSLSAASCSAATTCPPFAPVKCWDESCRVLLNDCPPRPSCPSTAPYLCHLGNCMSSFGANCRADASVCPTTAPVLCPTSPLLANVQTPPNCVTSAALCDNWFNASITAFLPAPASSAQVTVTGGAIYNFCPGVAGRIRCKDGSCAGGLNPYSTTGDSSFCREPTCPQHLPYMCPEGMCALNPFSCLQANGCPADTPQKCLDGTCADSATAACMTATCAAPNQLCADGSCQQTCAVTANGAPTGDSYTVCRDGSYFLASLPTTSSVKDKWGRAYTPCTDGYDYANTCPPNRPVRCNDGLCVVTGANCPIFAGYATSCINPKSSPAAQNAKPFTCADGTCSLFPEQCKVVKFCPFGTFRCNDGTCKPTAAACPIGTFCPPDRSIRCTSTTANPVCVSDAALCPDQFTGCPANYVRCPSTSVCVANAANCPSVPSLGNGCPSATPYKCWDGSCMVNAGACSLPNGCTTATPYLIPGGGCSKSPFTTTTTPPTCAGTLCPNGQCVTSATSCRLTNGCSASSPIRCANGACAQFPASFINPSNLVSAACPLTVVCDVLNPFLCPDQTCVPSSSYCRAIIPLPKIAPVTPNLLVCPDLTFGTTCKAVTACPSSSPILCADGGCRASVADCVVAQTQPNCTAGTFPCFDGSCASSPAACIKKQILLSTGQSAVDGTFYANSTCAGGIVCADGSCASSRTQCPLVPGCPFTLPLRCSDGTCLSSTSTCPTPVVCSAGTSPCEDGTCRKQCLPYAGCPLSAPFYCAGRAISCTASLSACVNDGLVSPPSTPSRRLLQVSTPFTPGYKQEACYYGCFRDNNAIPQTVSIPAFEAVTVTVAVDSSNTPRTQLIVPGGAYGGATPSLTITPVTSYMLNLPAQTGAVAGQWNSVPWNFADRVLSTPFTCSTSAGAVPSLNLTVQASIDRQLFNPAGTTAVGVQTPCIFVTAVDGQNNFNTDNSAFYNVAPIPNSFYTCGAQLSLSTTQMSYQYTACTGQPAGAPNTLSVTGVLVSLTGTGAAASPVVCLCYNLTTATAPYTVGQQYCLSIDTTSVAGYTLREWVQQPPPANTAACPAFGDSLAFARQSTMTLQGTRPTTCVANAGQTQFVNDAGVDNVCLGVLDTTVNYFHCVDASYYTRIANRVYQGGAQLSSVAYHLPNGCDNNVYAFVYIPMPLAPVPPTSTCDLWCQYKWVIIGTIIGFLVFSLVAGYAIYRLLRYREKYLREQAELKDLKDRAEDLDQFAGGLGYADEEVDMVANPLVIEMQELQEQIDKVNNDLGLKAQTESREIDQLEIERQRLHAEIARVKALMQQQQKAGPARAQDMPTSSPRQPVGGTAPTPATEGQAQRHEFGQAKKQGRKEL